MSTHRPIIAIDIGTKCGWCVRAGNTILHGTFDLSAGRHSSPGMRFIHFRARLNELLDANPGAVVFYEEVRRHMGVDAAHVYGGLLAVLQALCTERKVEFQGVTVQAIKRKATGKGNAKKDAMIAAAKAKWPGLAIEDDNQADALWLSEAAIEIITGRGGAAC